MTRSSEVLPLPLPACAHAAKRTAKRAKERIIPKAYTEFLLFR